MPSQKPMAHIILLIMITLLLLRRRQRAGAIAVPTAESPFDEAIRIGIVVSFVLFFVIAAIAQSFGLIA